MKTIHEFSHSGIAALEELIASSVYGSLEQAVASLAVFSHPKTVEQTEGRNIFLVVRAKMESGLRGKIGRFGGIDVMFDDNLSPKNAFSWANGHKIGVRLDIQYNHIVSKSSDVGLYTSLANIVGLPTFLSKLSDTHSRIKTILEYRSAELYGPMLGLASLDVPEGYQSLKWAQPLPLVPNVEMAMRQRMVRKPKDRTVRSARELGWYFSDYLPDRSLPIA